MAKHSLVLNIRYTFGKTMRILSVRVDELNLEQAKEKVKFFLSDSILQHTIFTPNPEMIVDATSDDEFRQILNSGDLNLCDGIGLKLIGRGKLHRMPGSDFFLTVCELAQEKNKSVYLLGARDNSTLARSADALRKKFPKLNIAGYNHGPRINSTGKDANENFLINEEENNFALDEIKKKSPDVIFVAFSHGKQEKWINRYLRSLPSVRLAMGVGGALDFISGNVQRAPKLVTFIGMEWLWRLIMEPWRIGRIYKATIKFTYLFLTK